MTQKDIFYNEIKELTPPDYHVLDNMEGITNPLLMEIDMLYRFADALSVKNANGYRAELIFAAIMGAAITLYFLYYDLSSSYLIIILLIVFLVYSYLFIKGTDLLNKHGRYLEYRVLAETLRIQFFISYAGIKVPVQEILPWIVLNDLKWIENVLSDLDLSQDVEKQHILEKWIYDQRDYHRNALESNEIKYKKKKRNQKYSLSLTIISYFLLFFLDVFLGHFISADFNMIHNMLKVIVGLGAVYTIFSVNYYGKLSLLNTILHHKRMINLYDKVESEIKDNNGVESEEIIISLAKECLIENGIWYSSFVDNKPEWVL